MTRPELGGKQVIRVKRRLYRLTTHWSTETAVL